MARAGLVLLCLLSLFLFTPAIEASALELSIRAPEEAACGDPFRVRISTRQELSGVEVGWQGRSLRLPLHKEGDHYRGGLLLGTQAHEQDPGTYWITVWARNQGSMLLRRKKVRILKREFPAQRLTVPEESLVLTSSQLQRYKREKREISEVLSSTRQKPQPSHLFAWPAQGEISSEYGLRRILNGEPRSPHSGLDLAIPPETPILSTHQGKVALTGEFLFEGKTVLIDHGLGVVSLYCHLSSVLVEQGQSVHKKEVIGLSGSTGRTTGPHLHFAISVLGNMVDPLPLLPSR